MTPASATPGAPVHGPDAPRTLIERVLLPFQEFAHTASSGGIVLIACTLAALAWANSPWGGSYFRLWETTLTVGAEGFALSKSLHHWINDGLMAVFFFLVGLEIKREMLVGELASLRQASLPLAAALGGMVVPALVFVAFTAGTPAVAGWGVPMATDIAFALGVLALLGPRVPVVLKVFLAALAIVDDIGAVLVIAFFYTAELSVASLGAAAAFLVLLAGLNAAGVRHPLAYAIVGFALWVAVLKSGVHATVAGVLAALTIPARTRIDAEQFLVSGRRILHEFEAGGVPGTSVLTNGRQQAAVQALETTCEQVQSPLQRLEHGLHPWVAFGIMPLFALANAGVLLRGDVGAALSQPLSLGIILGLLLGKPLGITGFGWLVVRTGLAELPRGVTWRTIHGASWLAGIGFTMSLFIAALAFEEATMLGTSKLAILVASLVAGVTGFTLLRRSSTFPTPEA